jgi:integrase
METLRFTDRWLRNLKAGHARAEYADAIFPGLRVRVGARSITWSLMVRHNGARKRITLGTFPELGLRDARANAEGAFQGLVDRPAEDSRRHGTLRDLLELKLERMAAEGRGSANQYRGYFLRGPESVDAVIGGDRPANEITPDDVTNWLRKIHQRGTVVQKPRAYLGAAFSLGMKADNDPTSDRPDIRFGITQNPVTFVGSGAPSKPRQRHLSFEELRCFWHGFTGRRIHPRTRLLLRLIIAMGGVRITEIVRSRKIWWERNHNNELWLNLPKTKNGREHRLPVPQIAEEALKAALLIGDPLSPYLFPSPSAPDAAQSLSGVSQAVRRWCAAQEDFEAFQPRDLRRTMKTFLIERNPDLNRDWIDVWHNHGREADVARKHYDWAQYISAKKAVAAAIDDLLFEIDAAGPEHNTG